MKDKNRKESESPGWLALGPAAIAGVKIYTYPLR